MLLLVVARYLCTNVTNVLSCLFHFYWFSSSPLAARVLFPMKHQTTCLSVHLLLCKFKWEPFFSLSQNSCLMKRVGGKAEQLIHLIFKLNPIMRFPLSSSWRVPVRKLEQRTFALHGKSQESRKIWRLAVLSWKWNLSKNFFPLFSVSLF